MKKRNIFFIGMITLMVLISAIAAGCGGQAGKAPQSSQQTGQAPETKSPAPAEKKTTAPAPAEKKSSGLPATVSIATHAVGSAFNSAGVAISTVVTNSSPMKMVVEATPGPSAWLPLMRDGKIEFGVLNQQDAYQALSATGSYKEKTPLRVVKIGPLFNKYGIYVGGDSKITTMNELKGKKVFFGDPAQVSNDVVTEAILATAGLKPQDIVPVPATSVTAGVKNVIEGKADASLGAIDSAVTKELQQARGARVLAVNPKPAPEDQARIDKLFPNLKFVELQPGPSGIDKPTWVVSADMYLVAPAGLDENVVYQVAKLLYEKYSDLKAVHPSMASMTPENSVGKTTIPFHPGAIKFYKEKGIWTADLEALQKQLLGQ